MWLEEWKNEAEEKGLNSKWTYAKAIASIKKYPLPLRTGKEAKILENIGDGIAKKLDERLAQYIEDGGDIQSLHIRPDLPTLSPPKRKRSNKQKETSSDINKSPELTTPMFSPNANHLKTGRKYVPKYRSGAYALIITLYEESQKPTYLGYMGKTDLQEASQPLCDKSFTMSDAGSHYTAWSSMGTLIEKGFIVKRSSPAKYYITDKGCELTHQLLMGNEGITKSNIASSVAQSPKHNGNKSREKRSSVPEPGEGLLSQLRDAVNLLDTHISPKQKYESATITNPTEVFDTYRKLGGRQPIGSSATNLFSPGSHYVKLQEKIRNPKNVNASNVLHVKLNQNTKQTKSTENVSIANKITKTLGGTDPDLQHTKNFNYWYVTDTDGTTLLKSKALVTIDDIIGLGFLIKSKREDLERSGALFKLDKTRHATDGFVYAYIADKDGQDVARPPEYIKPPSKSSTTITSEGSKRNHAFASSSSTACTGILKENPVKKKDKETISTLSDRIMVTTTSFSNISEDSCQYTTSLSASDMKPLFTLNPGLYDVVLCIDTTETTGGGKMKKEMADKLLKSGLTIDVRKLQLGDFLWIAKEKFGQQRELLLDFIIERKRMDDLASSIVDGRFKEQKFRLKNCGLKKLIYLVETYGSASHFAVPETTLRQAIMNTQVVDGLFVKETADVFDSVNYLKTMTRRLIKIYKDKSLHCLSMECVKKLKEKDDFEMIIQSKEQYLISFQEFTTQTEKNKMLTVREMFAKQLMQIKGVSAERVVAIVNKYPTPACLLTAVEEATTREEKENLLTNLDFGKAKKKVGAPISKQVFTLFNS